MVSIRVRIAIDIYIVESCANAGLYAELEGLYHHAVYLHLRLFAFFNTETRLERRNDLLELYFAAVQFLERPFKLLAEDRLKYVPYYIMQMVLAAGFALLKLLNSDFASKLPFDQGRHFVLQTVDAMRKCKVQQNDLLDRLAEVLAQLWKASSSGRSLHSMSQSPVIGNPAMASMFNNANTNQGQGQATEPRRGSSAILEDPLRLIMRSRMSMSVVFDCIQRWRESQISSSEHLDATVMNNPTNPDSSTNSTPPPGTIVESNTNPSHNLPNFNPHLNTLSMPLQLPNGLASANSFEIFDPVSWMLDVQPEWPSTYGAGNYPHDFGN